MYYLQSRYYDPKICRFINADSYTSTGQGPLGYNMFAYCLNNPIFRYDSNGRRTYVINGIGNDEEDDAPEYIKEFCVLLEENDVDDAKAIPVYTGQSGAGILKGIVQVVLEMCNIDVYTAYAYAYIMADLQEAPLEEGEKLNIIGYSGGGQIALNVAEKIDEKVDNVILIGTPVMEILDGSAKVSLLYSYGDPFSWNVGFGFDSYCTGTGGHHSYFKNDLDSTFTYVQAIIG